jgi:hypothetical protein
MCVWHASKGAERWTRQRFDKKMGKIKKQLIDDKYNTIFWPLFCPCISVLYPFKTSKY